MMPGFSNTLTNTQIGLIATIPYVIATIVMITWSRRSDLEEERKMHSALPLGLAAVALLGTGWVSNPVIAMVLISTALAGLYAFKAPFWAVPTLFLSRSTAAVSVAVINSIGNLGGFVGPSAIGIVKGATGSPTGGLVFLSLLLFVAFAMMALMRLTQPSIAVPLVTALASPSERTSTGGSI
jgi:ACS family tartrate transporter-like MFS transporter